MTSLLYRGAVVLSADNIDEILVPNGLPIAEGINGSITIPDALPGRVRSMSLYLCDSTQAPHFDTDPYWFYKVYPIKFHKVNFNKLGTNSDLLSSIDYYIDLMERIIIFYDNVIADTLAKQELYGITYTIDQNSWGLVYRFAYHYVYAVLPSPLESTPISFVDTYTALKYFAEDIKVFLESKYAEIYASGSANAQINMPSWIVGVEGTASIGAWMNLFFSKPINRFFFGTKKYKLGLYDNGLILYGSVNSRGTGANRTYSPFYSFSQGNTSWPYKYSYEDTKWENPLINQGNVSNNLFSTFNSRHITGFEYFTTHTHVNIFPIIYNAQELKKNQYHEVPYEDYPDIVGTMDTMAREPNAKFTKTKTKQFYAETRFNKRTISAVGLQYQHSYSHLYHTNMMGFSVSFTNGEVQKVHRKILANGLTNFQSYTPLHYSARYVIRPEWVGPQLSLWQSTPADLQALGTGSATPSFPERFLWKENEENPITMYMRSRTHIFNNPDNAGRVVFEPTAESSATPYTHWFGGSTQPPSLLRVKVIYAVEVFDGFGGSSILQTYFWLRLRFHTPVSTIEYTLTSQTDDPPNDFSVSNTYSPSLSNPVYETGIMKQEGPVIGGDLRYRRWVTISGDVLISEHYLDEYTYDEIAEALVVTNTFHLYTTQHHFSEPV